MQENKFEMKDIVPELLQRTEIPCMRLKLVDTTPGIAESKFGTMSFISNLFSCMGVPPLCFRLSQSIPYVIRNCKAALMQNRVIIPGTNAQTVPPIRLQIGARVIFLGCKSKQPMPRGIGWNVCLIDQCNREE